MTYVPLLWLLISIVIAPRRPGFLMACAVISYQFDNLYGVQTLGPALFILFVAVTAFIALTQNRLITLNGFDLLMILFGVMYVMSALYAPNTEVAFRKAGRLVLLCVGNYMIGRFYTSNVTFKKDYIQDFGVSLLILSAAFGYMSVGLHESSDRLSLGEGTPVGFSQMVDLAAAFSMFYMLSVSGTDAWAKRLAMAGLFVAVAVLALYNATRGTIVSVVFATCVYLAASIAQWRPGSRYLSRGLALSVLMVGASTYLIQFGDRISFLSAGLRRLTMNFGLGGAVQGDMSSGIRIRLFEHSLDMFGEAPFFGNGVGSFLWHGKPFYPHNLFLELLAENGVIITAVFSVLFFWTFWMAFRLFRKNRPEVTIAAGIFLVTAAHQQMSFSVWMAKGMFLFMGAVVTYYFELEQPKHRVQRQQYRQSAQFGAQEPGPSSGGLHTDEQAG